MRGRAAEGRPLFERVPAPAYFAFGGPGFFVAVFFGFFLSFFTSLFPMFNLLPYKLANHLRQRQLTLGGEGIEPPTFWV